VSGSLWSVIAVRAGMAEAGMFALAAVFARLGVGTVTGVLAYAACCGLAAIVLTIGWAVAVGLSGWAFLTGVVVNAYGQLTFARPDLEHLALLLALSVAVSLLRPRSGSQRSRV
jgi:hypothetical protein